MTTQQTLEEEERMRRVPGIIFVDGATGRRARVAGTGLEVFEIVAEYRWAGGDWDRLRRGFAWLSEDQLRAALAYAELYPEEIDARIRSLEAYEDAHYHPASDASLSASILTKCSRRSSLRSHETATQTSRQQ